MRLLPFPPQLRFLLLVLASAGLLASACSSGGSEDGADEDTEFFGDESGLDAAFPDEVGLNSGIPDPLRPVRLTAIQVGTCRTDLELCDVADGQRDASAELGVSVTTLTAPPGRTEVVLDHLQQTMNGQTDGLAVSLGDAAADPLVIATLTEIADAGIPVVTYGGDPSLLQGVDLLSAVGTDDYEGGFEAARALAQASGSGSGVCLNTAAGDTAADLRCSGFRDGLAQAGRQADILRMRSDPAAGASELSNYLAGNPGTALVLSVDTVGADAYYRYRATNGNPLFHGTFGMSTTVLNALNTRVTDVYMAEQPYLSGYYPISILASFLRYGLEPVGDLVGTGPTVTTPTTFSQPAAPDRGIRLVSIQYSRCQQDIAWCPLEEGQAAAAQGLGILHSVLASNRSNPADLPQLVDQAIASAPDGIALTIADPRLLAPAIKRINAAGIPVVGFHDGRGPALDKLDYLTYIGIDHYEAGVEAAERLLDAGGQNGGVCINHAVGSRSLDLRCNGFSDTLSRAGIRVFVLEIQSSQSLGAGVIANYYQSFPGTDIFLTLGEPAANAFYDFVDSGEVGGRPAYHGTFDLSPTVVERIDAGQTAFAVDQQPFLQGYWSVTMLAQKARLGLMPGTSIVETGPRYVTSDMTAGLGTLPGRYR